MYLNGQQLKNLSVVTKSGQLLGKIKDIEINTDTQNISKYVVKSNQITKRLAGKELIISPSQVISIDNQKMVVEDNVVKDRRLVGEPVAI